MEKNYVPINVNNIIEDKRVIGLNNKFKVVYFNFESGKGLLTHNHNGYAAIQVVHGSVDMEFETGEKFELKTGDFLPFDARVDHNLIAREDSKVLVTISEVVS